MTTHPLDRPVWHALAGDWAPHALGGDAAKRIDPAYNVFGAAADRGETAQAALGALVRAHGELWAVEQAPWPAPAGCRVVRTGELVQMVCHAPPLRIAAGLAIAALGEEDAPAMRMLAGATQPGPFAALTHRIGDFIGVRQDGRLIAMAGERMRPPGFAEVSGVCTDPAHRGRGLAAALIAEVVARIAARGETAWLTSYAANTRAVALYGSLGFAARCTMTLTVLDSAI